VNSAADLARFSVLEKIRDGRQVEIRAIRPEDRDELMGTVSRASKASLYRRFFTPRTSFSDKEIDYFLNVDFVKHVALVAVMNEDGRSVIAGGGRYIVDAPGSAELAFGLEDAYQGQGIASALMRHLVAIARDAGLEELHAEVLPTNLAMQKVFEKSGLIVSSKMENQTVQFILRFR